MTTEEETPEVEPGSGAERRRAERKDTDAPAKITLRNGIVVHGRFVDLSRTGGRFRAEADLPDLARWTTATVTYRDLEMKARVIWQRRSRDGSSEIGLEAVEE